MKALHELRPEEAGGAQLRHLHEKIHRNAEEKRQPRREAIDFETARKSGADIFEPVGQRVAKFEIGGRARLLHVIAGDRDRIEFRHVPRRKGKNVGDDPQRWLRRIDVRVADHEFLEDIVLNRPG